MAIPISFRSAASIAAILVMGAGFYVWSNQSLSGTYVNQTADGVRMIRLVETEGGKLAGQFESVTLTSDGQIQDGSGAIEGITDRKNINLSLHFTPLLPVPVTASGMRDGDAITLTVGVLTQAPITRVYKASALEAFQMASNSLRTQSQSILSDKAAAQTREQLATQQQNFITEVEKLISQIEHMNPKLDAFQNKSPTIEHQYRSITSQVHEYYNRAYAMRGDRYGVPRNQIIVAMNQGTVATTQISVQMQSVQTDFSNHVMPLANELAQMESKCGTYANNQAIQTDCTKLAKVGKSFEIKAKVAIQSLAKLDKTYQTELKSQQAFIQGAEQIQ